MTMNMNDKEVVVRGGSRDNGLYFQMFSVLKRSLLEDIDRP